MEATATMTPTTLAEDKARLIAEAMATHEQYPQYVGHWDGWVVAEAVRDLHHTRWGDLLLLKGERCLLNPASIERGGEFSRYPDRVFVTVYFARNLSGGCDTSWFADDFTVLG